MMYRLIVLNGPQKGSRVTVDEEPMLIGRCEECAAQFQDEEMALRHARIEQRNNELFITDLGSMSKIIVNKHEVKNARIKHGDIIELGRTRLLVEALVQAEVQTASPEPEHLVRRGRKRKLALAASVLLVAGGTFAILQQDDARAPEPAPAATVVTEVAVPEAPAVEAVAAEPAPNPLDERLRNIQQELTVLQQRIEQFNQSARTIAEPAPGESQAKPPLEIPDGAINEEEAIMTAAREAMEADELEQAELLLEHLRIQYPDYLPGYELRAQLYEELGMPGKAREQWNAVVLRSTGTDLYRRAMVERLRLEQVESRGSFNAHDSVRIAALEQVRFRESADYDEMRTVQIQLSYDRQLGPIDPKAMRLMIYFFEQDLDTRRINLSGIQPYAQVNLSALEQDPTSDRFTCAVNYVAPKGYYTRDHNTSRQRYYGFVARLHYFDNLVDEQARPARLLDPAILEAAGLAMQTVNNSENVNTPASF